VAGVDTHRACVRPLIDNPTRERGMAGSVRWNGYCRTAYSDCEWCRRDWFSAPSVRGDNGLCRVYAPRAPILDQRCAMDTGVCTTGTNRRQYSALRVVSAAEGTSRPSKNTSRKRVCGMIRLGVCRLGYVRNEGPWTSASTCISAAPADMLRRC
jgi:hypothetical protein